MCCSSAVPLILCQIIFTFNPIFAETSDQNIVSVNIKNILFNGRVETSVDGKQLNVFKGIPYAEQPLNELRFRKPVPIKEWPRTINAYDWPNPCYQYFGPEMEPYLDGYLNKNFSEDCLYLNIWSPIEGQNEAELRPVIFYIHGGGLLWGSASEAMNTGDVVAAKGDVVFVNINYRLSTLGFLYTGKDEAPGNVGLWDQALALEWVKDNIRYFGGDPDRITIMGMSAGSWSVSLHILSPVSRHMFRNAIMQSAAYTDIFIDGTPQQHIEKWLKAAELIGCNDEKNSQEFTPEILDCFRGQDPKTLAQVPVLPELRFQSIILFTLVVVDGHFLPKTPTEMLTSGDFKQNLNLMVSTAHDEGSSLLVFNDPKKFDAINPENLTFSQAFDELHRISSNLSNKFETNGEEVAKVYFDGLSDRNSYDLLRQTMGIAVGDYCISCPTLLFAKEVFRKSQFKTNVFQYLFNYKSTCSWCSQWMGACHGCDLFPSLGLPLKNKEYNDKDREVAKQMVEFITDFAKNDVPTNQNGAKWSSYFEIDGNIIAPYYEISNEQKSDTNFGVGLKITECEYLWRKYLMFNGKPSVE